MTFAIAGSGNVATHLSVALVKGGAECVSVYSRSLAHARVLAEKVGGEAVDELSAFFECASDADVVILSITDNAIPEVVEVLPGDFSPVVLHTSGSTPMDVLKDVADHGVLYPMQTFSKDRDVVMSEVPFFVEYNTVRAADLIHQVTDLLGTDKVQELSSENRMRVHLAAVFGCNFVNHFYALADECLEGTGVPFEALTPLLRETLRKALVAPPAQVQTGPAVRNDTLTMNRHLKLLEKQPHLAQLYKILSASIHEYNH